MAERYIGIDLNEKYAMISYYVRGMSEPGTFSMVTGSEVYQIPVCVTKRKGTRQWLYGEEAKKYAAAEGVPCADSLLKKALAKEPVELLGTIYDSSELLFLFLKRLLSLPPQEGRTPEGDILVITTENMNLEYRKLFGLFVQWMKLSPKQLILIDYRESFYYYALSQPRELFARDVALFYYTVGKLFFWRLSRDRRTIPQVVTIEESRYEAILKERDEEFLEIVQAVFAGKLISSVYLIGDGFDGGWMKKSLAAICRGRRAFMGKNLFSKGSCYAAAVKSGQGDWPYIYMGDNELKVNVSLKAKNQGKTDFLSLVTAGENWYEAGGEYEVILSGTNTVELWLKPPKSKDAVIHSLELTDLPQREDMTTRLRISAKAQSADQVMVRIFDMGFGEIARSSNKVWEYKITL